MKDIKSCHTPTYLTKEEESTLARIIQRELERERDRNFLAGLIPAPQELSDLIF